MKVLNQVEFNPANQIVGTADLPVRKQSHVSYIKECSITQLGISSSIERLKFK